MSNAKIIAARPHEVVVTDETAVIHVKGMSGLLVCAHDSRSKAGGVVSIPEPSRETVTRLVTELIQRVGRETSSGSSGSRLDIRVKVLGTQSAIDLAKEVIHSLRATVAGESTASSGVDAYFYSDTGRVRFAEAEKAAPVEPRVTLASPARKRVLIVDDSKTIRQLLTKILSSDPGLEVVGAAEVPSQAEKMIEELKPDVITLDIHMPEMDGVTLLKRYLPRHSIPTVMISSISMEEGTHVLNALEAGAVDYIQKPSFEDLDRLAPFIVEKVRTAAHVKVKRRSASAASRLTHGGRLNQNLIVAVGASTGGTEALRLFFSHLPAEIPPIVVVQHIPPVFSRAFANRLNDTCPFEVREAENGDLVQPNRVLIAPGGMQMALERGGGPSGYKVRVWDGEPVNRHKPSVDVLFDSVAAQVGKKSIGIIMTGMGRDGAAGMLKMRQAGSRTIAQDEASSVVFGMPKEAIKLGGAEEVQPLDKIAEVLVSWLQGTQKLAAGG